MKTCPLIEKPCVRSCAWFDSAGMMCYIVTIHDSIQNVNKRLDRLQQKVSGGSSD
jgi:hypothetical protein